VVEAHHECSEKKAFEDHLMAMVAEHDIELVVLARYMQILSPKYVRP
jgi:formyltetrahydrofolate deformylase